MSVRKVSYGGKVYASASGCRFVIFGVSPDGKPYVFKRSSNLDVAKQHRSKVANGLIVDFVGGKVYGLATEFKWETAA